MTRAQNEVADEVESVETGEPRSKNTLDVSLDEGFAAGNTGAVRRRVRSGTLIMGGVLLASAASLWSMRAIDRAVASAPNTDCKYEQLFNDALEKDAKGGGGPAGPTALLGPDNGNSDLKVPLKDLAKNPFVIWRDATQEQQGDPAEPVQPTNTIVQRITEWEGKVDGAAAAIKIQSTMAGIGDQGSVGIANINGHMMRAGDLFAVDKTDVEFTVDRIERNEVTFRAYNAELRHERLVIVKVNRKW